MLKRSNPNISNGSMKFKHYREMILSQIITNLNVSNGYSM